MKVILAGLAALAGTVPAAAQEPRIWRDPQGGCAYVVSPQGGMGLRYRRDGTPDCPNGQLPAGLSARPLAPLPTVSTATPS